MNRLKPVAMMVLAGVIGAVVFFDSRGPVAGALRCRPDGYQSILERDDLPAPRSSEIAGRVAARRGKTTEAEPLFKETLHVQQRMLPHDHPDVSRMRKRLAEFPAGWDAT